MLLFEFEFILHFDLLSAEGLHHSFGWVDLDNLLSDFFAELLRRFIDGKAIQAFDSSHVELNLDVSAFRRVVMKYTLHHLGLADVVLAEINLFAWVALFVNQIPLKLHSSVHDVKGTLVGYAINKNVYRVLLQADLVGLHADDHCLGFATGQDKHFGMQIERCCGLFLQRDGGFDSLVFECHRKLFIVIEL